MNEDRHEELARKLSAIEAPPPPEGLLEKLRGDIPDEFPVENRSPVRQFTGWSLGLAASILVMIGAAYFAISYQKSAELEVAAPGGVRTIATAQQKTASAPSTADSLQPTAPAPQVVAEMPNTRVASSEISEEQDLRKQAVASKRDERVTAPATANPQIAFAPEAPKDAAEPAEVAGVEGGVEGGVVGAVSSGAVGGAAPSAEQAGVARNEAAAAEPQRADAKLAAAPPAAPAPAQMRMKSEAPAPVRVGRTIPGPRVLRKVDPVIGGEAKKANAHGIVIVDVVIDPNGYVTRVSLLKGLPYGLSEAVLDAVQRWKFEPTVIDGHAVTVIYEIAVRVGDQ